MYPKFVSPGHRTTYQGTLFDRQGCTTVTQSDFILREVAEKLPIYKNREHSILSLCYTKSENTMYLILVFNESGTLHFKLLIYRIYTSSRPSIKLPISRIRESNFGPRLMATGSHLHMIGNHLRYCLYSSTHGSVIRQSSSFI